MSDDVISLAPPLSVSGPVVSMFAAWRDNLISGAAGNAKSRLSEGGGKKEVSGPGSAATSSPLTPHEAEGGSSAPSDWKDQIIPPGFHFEKSAPAQPQTPISVFFNHCGVTL